MSHAYSLLTLVAACPSLTQANQLCELYILSRELCLAAVAQNIRTRAVLGRGCPEHSKASCAWPRLLRTFERQDARRLVSLGASLRSW